MRDLCHTGDGCTSCASPLRSDDLREWNAPDPSRPSCPLDCGAQVELERPLNEQRRKLALRIRYPNESIHENERDETLAHADALTRIAKARMVDLVEECKKIDDELESYQRDVGRAPGAARRRLEDNMRSLGPQVLFMRAQVDERKQLNAHFDEERTRLMSYWRGTTLSVR